eukprot:3073296-Rhodomonas_salina.2
MMRATAVVRSKGRHARALLPYTTHTSAPALAPHMSSCSCSRTDQTRAREEKGRARRKSRRCARKKNGECMAPRNEKMQSSSQ